MVADLLEPGHGRQDQTAAADPVGGLLDLAQHLVNRRGVQGGLLGGRGCTDLHLLLVRQVGDDGLVGLQPAQEERLCHPVQSLRRHPQPYRSIGIANRSRNLLADPSRPGLVNSMMDQRSAKRFSTGVPVSAIRWRRARIGPPGPAWSRGS